ncbi:hypothetical protein BLNAU_10625 [Blattamonas nauphoetae]|uniref:Uncharacterized protein n=1 Tax=Blattamonas nauphoetae TaxID=2049346 RepID=A0ABQ9XPV2_9EUKA|nr:hypothetical protein BLNAU_10625 [Blattamonas nauphoetae]
MAAHLFDAAYKISGGHPEALLDHTCLHSRVGSSVRTNLELELNAKYFGLIKSLERIFAKLPKHPKIFLLSALASIVSFPEPFKAGFNIRKNEFRHSYRVRVMRDQNIEKKGTKPRHATPKYKKIKPEFDEMILIDRLNVDPDHYPNSSHAFILKRQISELEPGTAIVINDYKENWKVSMT